MQCNSYRLSTWKCLAIGPWVCVFVCVCVCVSVKNHQLCQTIFLTASTGVWWNNASVGCEWVCVRVNFLRRLSPVSVAAELSGVWCFPWSHCSAGGRTLSLTDSRHTFLRRPRLLVLIPLLSLLTLTHTQTRRRGRKSNCYSYQRGVWEGQACESRE